MELRDAGRRVGLLLTLIGAFLFVRPPSSTAADYILMPQSELMALPTSGSSWTAMLNVANGTWDSRDLQDQDCKSGAQALAAALVYARTGDSALRTKARNALFEAIATLGPGVPFRNSGLGPYRQIAPYILVADLIDLTGADETNFRTWLQWALTNPLGTHSRWGGGVRVCHDDSANNWGGWAGATRIAGWIYLGNTAELAAAANTTQGFLGDRSKWAQFKQPEGASVGWVCNLTTFTPVNPVCTLQGVNLSGTVSADISRDDVAFPGPPSATGTMYTREIVSGMTLQVELLYRNGYPTAYSWSTQAMKRMADVLTRYNAWNVGTVSDHVSWLLNRRYGTSYPQESAGYGRAFGYTDWLYSQPASHLKMVVEVFPGYASSPNAQYVELQMYGSGQNFVAGRSVQVFNAAGALTGTFTFPGDLPNGANQASILIATAEAQTLFGVTADLTMTPVVSASGGKACFDGSGDCVAWGNYSGSPTGVGNPFRPAGLTLGQAAQRRLDRGNPAILDPPPTDDTDDSATDFVTAAPTPRNNGNVTGAVPGYGSTPVAAGPIAFQATVVGFGLSANLLVQETGGRTLTVSNPVLGGAYPGDFSVDTSFPLNIANGAPPQAVQLRCTPKAEGARAATLSLTTNDPTRPTVSYDLTCTGLPVPPSLSFFTVTPCRVVDTRVSGGPVVAGADRTFTMVEGACGVPATAKAVSLNVAATQPTAAGYVLLFPAGGAVPTASAINYSAGQTRTNNAVMALSDAGRLTARCQPSGSTHLILDVNGYFE